MKSEFILNGTLLEVSKFPGGELNIRIPENLGYREFDMVAALAEVYLPPTKIPELHVLEVKVRDSDGIIGCLLIKDALDRISNSPVKLKLHYMPYSRQDRVCNSGEAFGLKVVANLINSAGFHSVETLDNHSDVATSLLDNVVNLDYNDILTGTELLSDIGLGVLTVVAPDAGSTKKIEKFGTEFIQCLKTRNLETGSLSGFRVLNDVVDADLVIVDDICDGGGTFIGLTKELYNAGAHTVQLYVTHGIFSKGLAPLYEAGITKIMSANTIYETNHNMEIV